MRFGQCSPLRSPSEVNIRAMQRRSRASLLGSSRNADRGREIGSRWSRSRIGTGERRHSRRPAPTASASSRSMAWASREVVMRPVSRTSDNDSDSDAGREVRAVVDSASPALPSSSGPWAPRERQ